MHPTLQGKIEDEQGEETQGKKEEEGEEEDRAESKPIDPSKLLKVWFPARDVDSPSPRPSRDPWSLLSVQYDASLVARTHTAQAVLATLTLAATPSCIFLCIVPPLSPPSIV